MTDNRKQPPILGEPAAEPLKTTMPLQRDHWFDNQLNELFSQVSSEPLPADLAALVQQLKAGDRRR